MCDEILSHQENTTIAATQLNFKHPEIVFRNSAFEKKQNQESGEK